MRALFAACALAAALAACTSSNSTAAPAPTPTPVICPLTAGATAVLFVPLLYPAPNATAVPTSPALIVVGLPSASTANSLQLTANGTTQVYPLTAAATPLPVPTATPLFQTSYVPYSATPVLAPATTYTVALPPLFTGPCATSTYVGTFTTR